MKKLICTIGFALLLASQPQAAVFSLDGELEVSGLDGFTPDPFTMTFFSRYNDPASFVEEIGDIVAPMDFTGPSGTFSAMVGGTTYGTTTAGYLLDNDNVGTITVTIGDIAQPGTLTPMTDDFKAVFEFSYVVGQSISDWAAFGTLISFEIANEGIEGMSTGSSFESTVIYGAFGAVPSQVPLPASALLLFTGLGLIAALRRRRA